MEKTISISRRHNQFSVKLDGTQTYVKLKNSQGEVLRVSKGKMTSPHLYTVSEGKYFIETDGRIVESKSVKVEVLQNRTIKILGLEIETGKVIGFVDGKIIQGTSTEIVERGEASLEELKPGLVRHYEEKAIKEREAIISTKDLLYASLGTKDDKTLDSYKATITEFEKELNKATATIKNATSPQDIDQVRVVFPKEQVFETKKPASKKLPATKKAPTKSSAKKTKPTPKKGDKK